MLKFGRLYCTIREFDLLASLKKCQFLFTMDKILKQTCIPHHFLYSIFEKHCTHFKPLYIWTFYI